MKLHIHPSHPDYHPASMHAEVFLDGILQNLCIHADEEAGTLERYVMSGPPREAWPYQTTETVRGAVRLEVREKGLELLKVFPR